MFIKPTVFGTLRFFNTKLPDIQYKSAYVFPLNYDTSAVFEYRHLRVLATDEEQKRN